MSTQKASSSSVSSALDTSHLKVKFPFKVVEFDLMYGKGISKLGELIDLGTKAGVV